MALKQRLAPYRPTFPQCLEHLIARRNRLTIKKKYTIYSKPLLLFLNDNAPGVLDVSVHDILETVLDLGGVRTHLAVLAHGDIDVLATVVNLGDGTYEILMIYQPKCLKVKKSFASNLQRCQKKRPREYDPRKQPP